MQATIKYLADAEAERRYGFNTFAEPYGNVGGMILFNAVLLPNIIVGSFAYDTTLGNFHVVDDVAQGTFLVSKTYEIITPESAELGEVAQCGFIFEEEPMALSSVIDLLRECATLSSTSVDFYTWAISNPEEDYFTGDSTTYHVHVRDMHNEPLSVAVLSRLYRLAGLIK